MQVDWKNSRTHIAVALIVCGALAVDFYGCGGNFCFGTSAPSVRPTQLCRPAAGLPLLATLYENGDGLPQNYAKAAELYRRQAEEGEHTSQYKLGMFYLSGKGVKQDYAQAYYWLSLAAYQQDYADGMSNAAKELKPEEVAAIDTRVHDWQKEFYGRQCTTETIGMPAIDLRTLPQDIKKNRPAAERGHADAQRLLAYFYYHAEDYQDSYLWSLLTARDPKCGSEWGCSNSGSTLIQQESKNHLIPDEVSEIEKRAREWKPMLAQPADVAAVQVKAEEGDPLAQWQLGKMYETGDGVKQDLAEAYFWYSLSMKTTHGDVSSGTENYVIRITHPLTPGQIVAVNARVSEWLAKHGRPTPQ